MRIDTAFFFLHLRQVTRNTYSCVIIRSGSARNACSAAQRRRYSQSREVSIRLPVNRQGMAIPDENGTRKELASQILSFKTRSYIMHTKRVKYAGTRKGNTFRAKTYPQFPPCGRAASPPSVLFSRSPPLLLFPSLKSRVISRNAPRSTMKIKVILIKIYGRFLHRPWRLAAASTVRRLSSRIFL